jgi:type I restriction enzyme M protein
MRGSVESAEYKHLVLGLLFLKYISDSFERRRTWLAQATRNPENEDYFTDDGNERAELLEDRDEYISENIFWVPEEARWNTLLAAASQPDIGEKVDKALDAIERDNAEQLRGVLPKIYARVPIQPAKLGSLVETIAKIGFGDDPDRARDILGRTYEYFIREFARAEGHRGGEFYTPRSVTRLLVEMLEPFEGRVLDPACGSGGLFVQSAEFVKAHGGRPRQISILGQENNQATWRIAKMNLAIHRLSGDLKLGDSLLDDQFPGVRADFVMANPPFNMKKWGAVTAAGDARWAYGEPPDQNANYAWIQNFVHHLAPEGGAGFVMAPGSLTSNTNGEGDIRQRIVQADLVECVVALPAQLFFTTGIAVCLWFVARNKARWKERDRRGETLFIDARKMGHKFTRTQIELSDADIALIAKTFHAWRGKSEAGVYEDQIEFCRSVSLEEIKAASFILTPGQYVGALQDEYEELELETEVGGVVSELRRRAAETQARTADVETALEALMSHLSASASSAMPLTRIARFVNGGAFTKDANGRGRPIIRIKELNAGLNETTLYTDMSVADEQIAREGDLLFSWSGSLDIYRWNGPEAIINQHIFKVLPEDGIPSWFLEAWVRRHLPSFRAIARDKATTMGHIKREHLEAAQVIVPLPDVLARWSALMEPLEGLRDARLEEIRQLDYLREAIMKSVSSADRRASKERPNDTAE